MPSTILGTSTLIPEQHRESKMAASPQWYNMDCKVGGALIGLPTIFCALHIIPICSIDCTDTEYSNAHGRYFHINSDQIVINTESLFGSGTGVGLGHMDVIVGGPRS